ncbi:MAG: nucleotide kinase domain-containing protein [Pseudomonadota bacterium]
MLKAASESLFWYWINERHSIYLKRARGEPKPWTDDPILRDHKFTNVFRQLDRGTVWLTDHVIWPHRDDDPSLLLFNIAWYRMFNWTGTGALLGWRRSWRPGQVARKLHRARSAGHQVFTGAHIVYGGAAGQSKIDAVVGFAEQAWVRRRELATVARESRRLETMFQALIQIRGVGAFIGYEIVSDLRHTSLLADAADINTWANVGPGALRGLRRLDPMMRPAEGLARMRELSARSRKSTAEWVPPMELRDVEHSLCEFDKYCRVKFGEGKTRSSYPGLPEKENADGSAGRS